MPLLRRYMRSHWEGEEGERERRYFFPFRLIPTCRFDPGWGNSGDRGVTTNRAKLLLLDRRIGFFLFPPWGVFKAEICQGTFLALPESVYGESYSEPIPLPCQFPEEFPVESADGRYAKHTQLRHKK